MDEETRSYFEKFQAENPLTVFSIYTNGQVKIVNDLGEQIREVLEQAFAIEQTESDTTTVDTNALLRAYNLFWLWVLGSYEIVRTMCGDKACFTPDLLTKLQAFKREVEVLRMPFAKQEYKGEEKPVFGELAISSIDAKNKDIGYNVKNVIYYIRPVMRHFERLMGDITIADVLKDHRADDKYQRGTI